MSDIANPEHADDTTLDVEGHRVKSGRLAPDTDDDVEGHMIHKKH